MQSILFGKSLLSAATLNLLCSLKKERPCLVLSTLPSMRAIWLLLEVGSDISHAGGPENLALLSQMFATYSMRKSC